MDQSDPSSHDDGSTRLDALEACLRAGVVEVALPLGPVRCSPGAARALGGASDGRTILRALSRESRRPVLSILRHVVHGSHDARELECTVETVDRRLFTCKVAAYGDADRRTAMFVLRDVTVERERERSLLGRARSAQRMVEMAAIGSWSLELETGELHWSDEVFRIHELPVCAAPTLEDALAFYPPEAGEQVRAGVDRSIAGHGPYDLEVPLITAKGRRIWVHTRGDVERGPDGEPQCVYGIVREVTERHEAQQRALESEQRWKLAIDGARDGVWDWDLESNTVHFSARWKELIGYEDHELPNDFAEWHSRVPDSDCNDALAAVQSCILGETPNYHAEFRMRHRDGSYRWILARGHAISHGDDGKATRLIGTHSDITAQVELRQELEAARDSAEAAARAKSSFLATMSHEIRTPMNGVLGLARLLLDTELDDEQRSFAESIVGSGSSLLNILNDILDLSKAEAGMLELESIPMDPAHCARDVVELMRVQAEAKSGLTVALEVEDGVPHRVLGDPCRLRQVLLNLVGNAVKFTPDGRIDLIVGTCDGDSDERRLRIAVRDTGIGIEESVREHLFEAFTQADVSTTRKFGGTGLGLSICKHLAERMDGCLYCLGNEDGGSTFVLEVPIVAAPETDDAGAGPGEATDRDYDGSGARALVVEDNSVNQLVSRKMLERMGFEVTVVENGEEAVAATGADAFDLVFMDCQMPVMDGFEATRRIREREDSMDDAGVPIIAMTANALEGDRERCLAAGMDDYVGKPIVREELIAALRRVSAARAAA